MFKMEIGHSSHCLSHCLFVNCCVHYQSANILCLCCLALPLLCCLQVTKQIRDIRQRSVVWTKFSHQKIEQEEERLPVSKILPTPIADLYFRSPLVEAMNVVDAKTISSLDKSPEPSSCIVRVSDWDTLLLNAKSQLAAFRNFVNENVREDEDLSFRCSSGLCGISRSHSLCRRE